jgi:type IV pilus assembly protein PilA
MMLSRIRKSMDERDEGFTLIELLVVMIIIGILAAIAIPVFLNQRKSGYDAGTKSDVKNAATAEETYYTDKGAYLLGTENASTTDLTVATLPAVPLPGWKRSGHTTSVVVGESTAAGTGKGYLITGTSESTKKFCYDSGASDKGVYAC